MAAIGVNSAAVAATVRSFFVVRFMLLPPVTFYISNACVLSKYFYPLGIGTYWPIQLIIVNLHDR